MNLFLYFFAADLLNKKCKISSTTDEKRKYYDIRKIFFKKEKGNT